MGGFHGTLWIVLLVVCLAATHRRRRWRRWQMMGPPWDLPHSLPDAAWVRGRYSPRPLPADQRESEVDALGSRVADLEARLDFTERLLAGRPEAPPTK